MAAMHREPYCPIKIMFKLYILFGDFLQKQISGLLMGSRGPKAYDVGVQSPKQDGSATDLVSVTLLRGEVAVHLMLANLPGGSYESAPSRFRETRSTILDGENFLTELLR